MDATRISNSQTVIMKVVQRGSSEVDIARYLSQKDFLSDHRNHCVPLLDVLDPGEGDKIFMVIPLLRSFDDPEFQSVDDAINFVQQTIEVGQRSSLETLILNTYARVTTRVLSLCMRKALPIGALQIIGLASSNIEHLFALLAETVLVSIL